jgi:hypothetical protein
MFAFTELPNNTKKLCILVSYSYYRRQHLRELTYVYITSSNICDWYSCSDVESFKHGLKNKLHFNMFFRHNGKVKMMLHKRKPKTNRRRHLKPPTDTGEYPFFKKFFRGPVYFLMQQRSRRISRFIPALLKQQNVKDCEVIRDEDGCVLVCCAVLSGTYWPTFRGACCLHPEGEATWREVIDSDLHSLRPEKSNGAGRVRVMVTLLSCIHDAHGSYPTGCPNLSPKSLLRM